MLRERSASTSRLLCSSRANCMAGKRSAQNAFHAAWRVTPCRAAMPSQRSRSPNRAPAHAVKQHNASCALLGVRRSCTILSFAHHLTGGERRWSGSAIGAARLSELAPIARSGSDGRRKQRAQACFILALLYSSAPCWLLRLGMQKRRRYSAFAGTVVLTSFR